MMYYNIYNGHTMGNCKMTNSVYRDSNVYQHENKHHLFLHIETIKCLKRKKKRTNKISCFIADHLNMNYTVKRHSGDL